MRLRVLAVVVATLAPLVAAPSAIAQSAAVELSSSAGTTTFGESVTLSGTTTGDTGCTSGRAVELQRRAEGSTFATVATGTTGANGGFAFEQSPTNTGRFRAVLPAAGECVEATSDAVVVGVKVRVEAAAAANSIEAGSCVEIVVAVFPPKPAQTVELQRRSGGAWSRVEDVPLNGDGEGRAEPCPGWDDVGGVARYRLRWIPQDELNEQGTSPTLAIEVTKAGWMDRIDDAIGGRAVSVSVSEEDVTMYRHADGVPRTPASNEKLLLAMATLDTFGPDHRILTRAAAAAFAGGVVDGDLWILGRGDPLVGPSSLGDLAAALVDAGLSRVTGSVMGSTAFFRRDWNAPGWNEVARDYVNRPTALSFRGNGGADPERLAARSLTKQLEKRGVSVRGAPGSGAPPKGLDDLAEIESKPLTVLLAKVLRPSWNFGAEVLGKGLGAEVRGTPGTIAKGAATIEAWASGRGVEFALFDNSGLSYDNRVTAAGIVELLAQAEDEDWGDELRHALPTGGQGTLEDRLHGVQVRAKTGSLEEVSALSGWVFAEQRDAWIEFSILCAGMSKPTASTIEDQIVRILQNNAA